MSFVKCRLFWSRLNVLIHSRDSDQSGVLKVTAAIEIHYSDVIWRCIILKWHFETATVIQYVGKIGNDVIVYNLPPRWLQKLHLETRLTFNRSHLNCINIKNTYIVIKFSPINLFLWVQLTISQRWSSFCHRAEEIRRNNVPVHWRIYASWDMKDLTSMKKAQ